VKEILDQDVAVDPLADQKVEFLKSAGRDNTVDFPCYADRYPVEMLEYLRLMQMTPEDTRYVHILLCDSAFHNASKF
jgi:histone-lysine N-methyltransferase SETD3